MNGTRERILLKSREIFNERGIQSTTLRQIAVNLGMSQGNLNYHFKTRDQILETLYFELVERMNIEIQTMTNENSAFSILYASAEKSMLIFYDYRFLLRDIYAIFRENEKIKTHYLGLQQLRKTQFAGLFQTLINQGLMRKEEFTDEYERLYQRMNILGDNWINAADLSQRDGTSTVLYYHKLLFEVIYPYLTGEGKTQFLKLT